MKKLALREKIGYGLGDFACSMFWKIVGVYLLFFYTDIFGISAEAAATMFLIVRVFDAVNDPLVGILADRTNTKWGKFRPYIFWMAIPFAIFGVLSFSSPSLTGSQKIIYAYATHFLMMAIYTAVNVPYAALMGVMTSNLKDRNALASFRFVFAFAGGFFALATAEPLVAYFSGGSSALEAQQSGWQYAVTIFAVLAAVLLFGTFYLTKERVYPPKGQKTNVWADLKDLASNRPWFILLGAAIFTLVFNSIRDGAAIYYFKYYFGNSEALNLGFIGSALTLSAFYVTLGQISSMLGSALAKPISDKLGKKATFISAMVIASVLSTIFFFFTEEHKILIFIFQIFISICAGMIFPILWSMYADVADYSEWKTGRRATGLIFSSSSMSQKFGWTIGSALTGWILAYYGFEANVEQTLESKTGIRLMMSVIPAVGALLSGVFILFYRLNDNFMRKVNIDLNSRRIGI